MPMSLLNRVSLLAAGAVVFALGVMLTEFRMDVTWAIGPRIFGFGIALVAMVWLLPQGAEREAEPSAATSTLCVLSVLFAGGLLTRLAVWFGSSSITASGTLTWMGVTLAAFAFWLGMTRHSAVTNFLGIAAGGGAFIAACTWLFSAGTGADRWLLLVLAIVYALASEASDGWPRMAALWQVAAGVALVAIAASELALVGALVTARLAGHAEHVAGPSWWWKIVVLVGGLGLIAAAWRRNAPGVGWVAFFVLFLFLSLTAVPHHGPTLLWWPLILLVLGVGMVASAGMPGADRAVRVAAGSVPLLLGIYLTVVRMEHSWARGWLLAVAAVPTVLIGLFVVRQPREKEPAPATSLLAIVAVILFSITIGQLGALHHSAQAAVSYIEHPFGSPGQLTWELAAETAFAAGLAALVRSAAVALVALLLFAELSFIFVEWAFNTHVDFTTSRWVLLGVAVAQLALAAASAGWWPRLSAVSGVSAGVVIVVIGLVTTIGLTLASLLGVPSDTPFGARGAVVDLGWGWELALVLGVMLTAGLAMALDQAGPGWIAVFVGATLILLDVTRVATFNKAHTVTFWPLLLLLVGGAAMVAGAVLKRPEPEPAPA